MKNEEIRERRMALPDRVRLILNRLTEAGYEAFVVGGCVRDTLLGRIPGDWDITTQATPQQIKALFRRTVDTGIQHGTVTVLLGNESFEVTTYRIDGEYEDARHPREVSFTASLEEDLRRRDFTVNAMAYNEQRGMVDLFGGERDLQEGIIRCVGDAEERFTEDALRMMRAVRFCAQLNYRLEERTKEAIGKLAGNLALVSAERIQAELNKLVVSAHPEMLRIAWETGLLDVFLPEMALAMETAQNCPHHDCCVGEHILRSMQAIEPRKELRLTMLFHDIGKPQCRITDENGVDHFDGHAQVSAKVAEAILKRLKYDNHTLDTVCCLVEHHGDLSAQEPGERETRYLMNLVGEDRFLLLLKVARADVLAQSNLIKPRRLERLDEWEKCYARVLERGDCVSLRALALTGRDLIAMGMQPGREIGQVLSELLTMVLDQPERNTKEQLTAAVKEICNL